jgi:hypothetical protein
LSVGNIELEGMKKACTRNVLIKTAMMNARRISTGSSVMRAKVLRCFFGFFTFFLGGAGVSVAASSAAGVPGLTSVIATVVSAVVSGTGGAGSVGDGVVVEITSVGADEGVDSLLVEPSSGIPTE